MSEVDKWFQFDGDDSCEDCSGWDGYDQGCECGNRRVAWECLNSKCQCIGEEEMIRCSNSYASAY